MTQVRVASAGSDLPGASTVSPDSKDPIPARAVRDVPCSTTRTAAELSAVCLEAAVPEGFQAERGWRILRVDGTQDFSLVGVLDSLTAPLAEAGISSFAISTFDPDDLLSNEPDLERAIEALIAYGHVVSGSMEPTTTV